MLRGMKRPLILLLLLSCASAPASTLTVTSLADDGSAGTLRAVVAAAQDGDVVTFADSLAGGTMTIVKTAHADTGIRVSASISIIGPADRSIALDGGFHGSNPSADIGSTILQVAGADVSLVCENLVFQHANGRDWGSAITYGGAVCCEGDATFRNCVFASNQVASVKISGRRSIYGGAIDVGGDRASQDLHRGGDREAPGRHIAPHPVAVVLPPLRGAGVLAFRLTPPRAPVYDSRGAAGRPSGENTLH